MNTKTNFGYQGKAAGPARPGVPYRVGLLVLSLITGLGLLCLAAVSPSVGIVTTSSPGLAPTLDGNSAHYLSGVGTWTAPAGGGGGGSNFMVASFGFQNTTNLAGFAGGITNGGVDTEKIVQVTATGVTNLIFDASLGNNFSAAVATNSYVIITNLPAAGIFQGGVIVLTNDTHGPYTMGYKSTVILTNQTMVYTTNASARIAIYWHTAGDGTHVFAGMQSPFQ
jgi:hypothetical protein